jgi:hypothetical protein
VRHVTYKHATISSHLPFAALSLDGHILRDHLSHFHHHHHHAPSPPTFYNVGGGSTARFDRHRLRPLPCHHPNDANGSTNGAPWTPNEGRRPCHVRGMALETVSARSRHRPYSSNISFAHKEPRRSQDNELEGTAPGRWGIGNTTTR